MCFCCGEHEDGKCQLQEQNVQRLWNQAMLEEYKNGRIGGFFNSCFVSVWDSCITREDAMNTPVGMAEVEGEGRKAGLDCFGIMTAAESPGTIKSLLLSSSA